MQRVASQLTLFFCAVLMAAQGFAQQRAGSQPVPTVPNLVKFGGTLTDLNGKPMNHLVGVTFSLYADSQNGAPIWMETQNVQPDSHGYYSVILGSTTSEGLPASLFASGEARWLGVQMQGYDEQPRVLLLSVPYALKAGDAATIGGLPPTAFVLAAPGKQVTDGSSNVSLTATVSGSGTPDFIPLWNTPASLGNSVLFQSGSGSSATIGINTTTPAATLDVNGNVISRGPLQLPSTGTANAGTGFTSQPFSLQGSSFNSGSGKAIGPLFQWQTEPTGNNTSNPAGTLNLLYGNGTGSPVETGLNIASNGQITFATGQTFPGTGNGTITDVIAGTDLIGGGSSGNVTLNVDTTQVVTGVTAGTDLTGGGTGGVQTLSLDTTKVPQLSANDSFTGAVGIGAPANSNGWTPLALGSANSFGTWMTLANTSAGGHTWNFLSAGSGNSEGAGNLGITDFTGTSKIFLEGNVNATSLTATGAITTTTGSITGSTLTATGSISGSTLNSNGGFYLGGTLFATGSYSLSNAFVGFSGNPSSTGTDNTATGVHALQNNTTGQSNTADGDATLYVNTTGSGNVATGADALDYNTTGNYNTAVGNIADGLNTTGNYNTALGYEALYSNQTGSYNTGLGWAAGPGSSNLSNSTAIGAYSWVTESNALVLGSIYGINGASANALVGIGTTAPTQSLQVDSGNVLVRGTNNFQVDGDTANLFLGDTNNFIRVTHGTGLTLGTFSVPIAVRINQYSGFVGIGTSSPTNRLTLGQGSGAALGDGWLTYSSRRWKTHIQTLDGALAKVEHLRGVSYETKGSGKHEIGVIAEEVGQVVPEVVSYEQNGRDARGVDYSRLTPLLIEAVKQQQRQIRTQQRQIRAQQQQILRLNNQVGVLQAASHAGVGSRPASAANVTGQMGSGTPNEQELRIVRRQLHQLRTSNTLLEARLTRLEHALTALGPRTVTIATAAVPASDKSSMKGEIHASPAR